MRNKQLFKHVIGSARVNFRIFAIWTVIKLTPLRARFVDLRAGFLFGTKNDKWWSGYIAFNKYHLNYEVQNGDRLILMDCSPLKQWIVANSIFLNVLSKQLGAQIVSYGVLHRTPILDAVYKSFGSREHLRVQLDQSQSRRCIDAYRQMSLRLQSAEDLFNLKIDGIWIGLDIYESTLRSGAPTLQVNSFFTQFNLYRALQLFIYFSDLMSTGRVVALSLSHDCYVHMGLVMKIAQKNNIPVYFINPYEMVRSYKTHDIYQKFRRYRDYLNTFDQADRVALIGRAKDALAMRLGGHVGIDMPYQLKSAYSAKELPRQTAHTNKIKILVATHCFYDNPHAYGGMIFRDFYQWIDFLGSISMTTDYEWYIKPHRDYLPGTIEILRNFVEKYQRFKLIDSDVSFSQLKREGISIALTCYGSVGHELPLIGFQVINAGYNPHIAYAFCTHCLTVQEYELVLKNLTHSTVQPMSDDIYEFYAVHHYVVRKNLFDFESIEGTKQADCSYMGDDNFLDRLMRTGEQALNNYRMRAERFIISGSQYEFELRLSSRLGVVPPVK
jgi:hypothetical protein